MKQILFLFFLFPHILFAQLSDNFTDGDFKNNPKWNGDTAQWVVLNGQLKSNGPAVTTTIIYLSAPSTITSDCQWEFFANPKLATSSGNFMDVFLISDQQNLNGNLNGYFVRIGGTKDEISLFKKEGALITKIIDGTDGIVSGSSNNPVKVKTIRKSGYDWSLETDNTGSGINYVLQGNATDATFTSSNYFGILVNYSAANCQKYFFDDFYVGPIITDSVKPVVSEVNVISANELDVLFSEPVNQTTAENLANYVENGGSSSPASASRDNSNAALVHLNFTNSFLSGIPNSVIVKNIRDLAGNTMLTSNAAFLYYKALAYDIVFNEIMIDPTPAVSLPEQEYIELYNKTAFPVNMANWTFNYGSTSKTLPEIIILPDSFIVLCADAAYPDFEYLGNVIAVPGLSSSALTNGGTALTLSDKSGVLIHTISYTNNWYGDDTKKEGGWSIEQIDPLNPCGADNNWRAAINYSGGTPGKKNSVYAPNPDLKTPQITEVCVTDSQHIDVLFSENINAFSVSDLLGYEIDHEIGKPDSIVITADIVNFVSLVLSHPLTKNTIYNLTVTNPITDCVGNSINFSSTISFSLYEALPYEIVINEVMADPEPVVGLPEYEYIELYNRSAFPVNLNGWTISAGSSTQVFSCVSILPGDFLIVCNANNQNAFSSFGKTGGIPGFNSLTNSGSSVILKNEKNEIISAVSYSDSWHKSSNKINGGWSLEQVDVNNACAGASNWITSKDETGGTPGKVNSVKGENPDISSPTLIRALILDSLNIRLYFSESLMKSSLLNPLNYTIDQGIGFPVAVSPLQPTFSSVIITLAQPVYAGIIYSVTITDSITDCAGNSLEKNSSTRFAFPEKVQLNDIVINEILFNPEINGVDFIEIYNRSTKIIDLKETQISTLDEISNSLTAVETIDSIGYLMFPNDYLVLCTSPDSVKAHHYSGNPKGFITMSSMPSYNNGNGQAVLHKINEELIDQFAYTEEMQFPLLNSFKGVSLERINPDRPANDPSNWHSASESVGFATPAYKNSQYLVSSETSNEIQIDPKLFSPDNDGYHDVVNINYNFKDVGNLANVTVYDAKGFVVRSLLKNELLGTKGTFSWDGITESKEKAIIGIYIIHLEIFDLKGNVKKYKYSCVLGGNI